MTCSVLVIDLRIGSFRSLCHSNVFNVLYIQISTSAVSIKPSYTSDLNAFWHKLHIQWKWGQTWKWHTVVYENGGLLCTNAPVVSPRKQHYHSHPALTSLSTDGRKWQKGLSCLDSEQLGPALSNTGKEETGQWKCPGFEMGLLLHGLHRSCRIRAWTMTACCHSCRYFESYTFYACRKLLHYNCCNISNM